MPTLDMSGGAKAMTKTKVKVKASAKDKETASAHFIYNGRECKVKIGSRGGRCIDVNDKKIYV